MNLFLDLFRPRRATGVGRRAVLATLFAAPLGSAQTANALPAATPNAGALPVAGGNSPDIALSATAFGAKGDGIADDTDSLQAALDACQRRGGALHIPAGMYRITRTLLLPPDATYEGRDDAIDIFGDGAPSAFLGSKNAVGTTIFSSTDVPLLRYVRYPKREVSGHLLLRRIRFEQTNSQASAPVLLFDVLANYSKLAELEIWQEGRGNGITLNSAWLCTLEDCNILNRDAMAQKLGDGRTGVGVNVPSDRSGGFLRIQRVTARGFKQGFVVGDATTSLYSTKFDQAECSMVQDGITIQTGMTATVLDTCYFEGIEGNAVVDRGTATTVRDGLMFIDGCTGIVSTAGTFANSYERNTILLTGDGATGIELHTQGDAVGNKKTVRGNYIFFQESGDGRRNVAGVRLHGHNPAASIEDNVFRPNRAWAGAAGIAKLDDRSTGQFTGKRPVTDDLIETTLYAGIGLSLAEGQRPLTEADIRGGVLLLTAASVFDVAVLGGAEVRAIDLGDTSPRIVILHVRTSDIVFRPGPKIVLAGDFRGPGILTLNLRGLRGKCVAYELSRTALAS